MSDKESISNLWSRLAFGSNRINEAPNYEELSPVDRGESSRMESTADLESADSDPAGQTNVPASEDPDEGLVYEQTVKNELEKARKAYFGDKTGNSMGALNPRSGDNSYDVSIELPKPGSLEFATEGNQQLKAELKLMPARFGSLRVANLSSFEFTGTGLEWEWKSTTSEEERKGSDVVLKLLSEDSDIISFLSRMVDTAENVTIPYAEENLKATSVSLLPLNIKQGIVKSAHLAIGGDGNHRSPRYSEIGDLVRGAFKRLPRGGTSETLIIEGKKWIQMMGLHKDIILLGDTSSQCSGKIFSLNDKAKKHFPILKLDKVEIRFSVNRTKSARAVPFRIQATPGEIENWNKGPSFSSGIDLYDLLVRTMTGFEESFEKAAKGREKAGQDTTVEDAIEKAAKEFLSQNPGSTADRERDRQGIPIAWRSRQAMRNWEEDGILPLGTESLKRKYSLTKKLLGK